MAGRSPCSGLGVGTHGGGLCGVLTTLLGGQHRKLSQSDLAGGLDGLGRISDNEALRPTRNRTRYPHLVSTAS